MDPIFGLVKEFHEKFGVPVGQKPTTIPLGRVDLRYDLIFEELEEYRVAAEASLSNGGLSPVADALADLLYVVMGTVVEHGFHRIDEIVAEVHRSNLSKLDPITGKPILREDGKVLKGANFSAPDLKSFLE